MISFKNYWDGTWKSRKSQGKIFLMKKSGEIMKILKSGKNEIVLANDLQNVDVACCVSIFCQRIRVISVTFCYTTDNLESWKSILSRGK